VAVQIEKEILRSILTLSTLIEARDPYTGGHTWRVSQYALALARKAGFDRNGLFLVNLGGLVHDLGKIGIPDHILRKPDKLTDDEFAVMKKHPGIGRDLIEQHPLFPLLKDAVLYHHERFDGAGYPSGLARDGQSIIARVMSIADSFDAMTSTRPYRRGMPPEKAISILLAEKGKQFDGTLVDSFVLLHQEGKLDHVLGHSGEDRLLLTCGMCGPIIDYDADAKDGSTVTCPNCTKVYVLHSDHGRFSVEETERFQRDRVPSADFQTLTAFFRDVPRKVEPRGYQSQASTS
jgi:HD-GYP domain-containing protein (c-di-GMP phosphodiesterase class II)